MVLERNLDSSEAIAWIPLPKAHKRISGKFYNVNEQIFTQRIKKFTFFISTPHRSNCVEKWHINSH